jgi:hypothetical protein
MNVGAGNGRDLLRLKKFSILNGKYLGTSILCEDGVYEYEPSRSFDKTIGIEISVEYENPVDEYYEEGEEE